jgi:hypothetical protein
MIVRTKQCDIFLDFSTVGTAVSIESKNIYDLVIGTILAEFVFYSKLLARRWLHLDRRQPRPSSCRSATHHRRRVPGAPAHQWSGWSASVIVILNGNTDVLIYGKTREEAAASERVPQPPPPATPDVTGPAQRLGDIDKNSATNTGFAAHNIRAMYQTLARSTPCLPAARDAT